MPAAAHRTTPEFMASEHARDAGLVERIHGGTDGGTVQPGPAAWVLEFPELPLATPPTLLSPCPPPEPPPPTSPPPPSSVPPPPGTSSPSAPPHPPAVSAKWQSRRNAQATPSGTAEWLRGVRVLDLTNVIAGSGGVGSCTTRGKS